MKLKRLKRDTRQVGFKRLAPTKDNLIRCADALIANGYIVPAHVMIHFLACSDQYKTIIHETFYSYFNRALEPLGFRLYFVKY